MKSFLLLLVAVVGITACSNGQNGPRQRKSPHDTISNANYQVTYGRPYKKDREIFGKLEPFGKVWRLGADEATTITFNKAVTFGGQSVPAGTYTMFALLNEKEWTIILNSQLNQWGAFKYEENKAKDVAQMTVPVKKAKQTEQLTMEITKKNALVITWDQTSVTVPFKF